MAAGPAKVTCPKCGYRSRPAAEAATHICPTCGTVTERPAEPPVGGGPLGAGTLPGSAVSPPASEPASTPAPPVGAGRGGLAIGLGATVGVILGAGLMVAGPRAGLIPLAGGLAGATAVLGVVAAVLGRDGRAVGFARAAASGLVAAWVLLGVGAIPPVARALRLATLGPPPPRRPAQPPSPWARARVVLVGPGGAAVGLAPEANFDGPEYLLVATADRRTSEVAVARARLADARVVTADASLIGPLMRSVGAGHPIPAPAAIAVARLLFDREPWAESDLVLTGPDGAAVGLARVVPAGGKSRGYALTAKAPSGLGDLAAAAAFEAGRPVLEVDRAVLGSLARAPVALGAMIDLKLAARVDALFRPRRFGGREEFVCFEDIQARRRRVGISLGIDAAAIRFVELLDGGAQILADPLAPGTAGAMPPPEVVSRKQIPANSLRAFRTDGELREAADLLDYLLFRMAGRLNAPAPVALRLAVLPTSVLDPVAEARRRRDASRAEARREPVDPLVAQVRDALTVYENFGPDSLARFAPEVRLALEAQRLAAELRQGLSRLRIDLREVGGPDAIEIAVRGLALMVPPGETDLRNRLRAAAARRQLLGATHVLASEVAPAEGQGRYHLALRLYEVDSGKQVFAEQGTRREAEVAVLGSELAAYPYLLNTGEVSLLDLGDKVHLPFPRDIRSMPGGLPLRLGDEYQPTPMVGNEKTCWEISRYSHAPSDRELRLFSGYPVPAGIFARLGYREAGSPGDPKAVQFRDLFGRTIRAVPPGALVAMAEAQVRGVGVGVAPVPSFGSVPYAHQMRYLIWTLARGVLPVAGRVAGSQGEVYRVDVGPNHRLHAKDRLVVRRAGEFDAPDRILATELVVTQAEDDYVAATLAPDQAALPGAEAPMSGDIAQRKPTEKVRVAVAPPSIIAGTLPTPATMPSRPTSFQRAQAVAAREAAARVQEAAHRLAEMVGGGLKEAGVPIVERRELDQVLQAQNISDVERQLKLYGRISRASHVVVGNIKAEPQYMMANLKLVEVATGDVVASIAGYHFTRATREAWKP